MTNTDTADTMTYTDFLNRLIDDGIAEVRTTYGDPEVHHKRDGAIAGFEACRGKKQLEIVEIWHAAEAECFVRRRAHLSAGRGSPREDGGVETQGTLARAYWQKRYEHLQLEWVLNVLSVGQISQGLPAFAAHLPTVRATVKYAQIMGTANGISHGPDWDDRKVSQ